MDEPTSPLNDGRNADTGEPTQGRPPALNDETSQRMSRQPSRDTKTELALRRRLHRAGLRYRVHWPVPGMARRKIDVAVTRLRIAIFVDGCFWHGCEQHCRLPRHNRSWWERKIDVNQQRDQETDRLLILNGWRVLRFWEHTDLDVAVETVLATVRDLRAQN